jgi:hypothetical protein
MTANRIALRCIACVALTWASSCAGARTYEQSYLRADDNWSFRAQYRVADRLFNGFDYGHAILSETLLRHPADFASRLDGPIARRLVCDVLRDPPSVPLEERAIAPAYGTALPEVVAAFEWAHMLHRQLYDIIADEPFDTRERDARVEAALRYYRSRPDLALSSTPKSMTLMEGQPYSLAFRRAAPRYNGIIWSYHWLQMRLYDALHATANAADRQDAVARDVERFQRLIGDSGRHAPKAMPMAAAVSPDFTRRYPDAAIIFDNLHSLHDVVSDVLASRVVAPTARRATILTALARYQDASSFTTSREEWIDMARSMGGVDTTALDVGGSIDRCAQR